MGDEYPYEITLNIEIDNFGLTKCSANDLGYKTYECADKGAAWDMAETMLQNIMYEVNAVLEAKANG